MSGIRDISASTVRILADNPIIGPLTTHVINSDPSAYLGDPLRFDAFINGDPAIPSIVATTVTQNVPLTGAVTTSSRYEKPVGFRPMISFNNTSVAVALPNTAKVTSAYGVYLVTCRILFATVGGGSPSGAAGYAAPAITLVLTVSATGPPLFIKQASRTAISVRNIAVYDVNQLQELSAMIPMVIPVNDTSKIMDITATIGNFSNASVSYYPIYSIVSL
jgi:hypothetical protein